MQKVLNKKILSVLLITLTASLAAAVYRLYLLYNVIDPETGFYQSGNNAGTYFNVVVIVLCVFIAVGTLLLKKIKAPTELKSESTPVIFSSSLCGFLFLTVMCFGFYRIFTSQSNGTFFAIEMVLCIPCVVNFFYTCAKEMRDRNAVQTLLSLFPALFYAVRTVEKFMDVSSQINASQRSLTLLMFCSAMLFFVCETGFFLPGTEKNKEADKSHTSFVKYFGAGAFTLSFAIVAVLPYLAVSAFWRYNSEFIIMDILDACIGLYAMTRLMSLTRD